MEIGVYSDAACASVLLVSHRSRMSKSPQCWMKAFGRKSKWAASTCAYSLSATRWACRVQFTTSIPRVGSPLPKPIEDIQQGKEKAAAYAEAHLKANRQSAIAAVDVEEIPVSVDYQLSPLTVLGIRQST